MKNRAKYASFLIAQVHILFAIAAAFKMDMTFQTTFALVASLISVGWVIYEGVVNLDDVKGKSITHLPKHRCVFFHSWKWVKGNGYSEYYECRRCGARRVHQPSKGFQPVDKDWLFSKATKKMTEKKRD